MFAGYAELTSMVGFSVLLMVLASRDWIRLRGLGNPAVAQEFAGWVIRGWITPLFLWTAWNLAVFAGWLDGVIPLLPGVPLGPIPGKQLGDLVAHSAALVVFAVTTHWMAFTQLRLLEHFSRAEYAEDPKFWRMLFGIVVFPLAGFVAWWLGPAGWGLSSAIVLWFGVQFLTREPRRHVPAYGRAVARMKFGNYREAEQEIIQQLEQCEDDYEGWMLLAQLYAERFGELKNASDTVFDVCSQPAITPFQISRGFNRLADWQLAHGNDPKAAKAALEEVVRRAPGTPFARTAEQRIALLPLDREELQEQRAVKRLRLPSLSDGPAPTIGTQESAAPSTGAPVSPTEARAASRRRLTRLLTRMAAAPDDWSLREQRWKLLGDELGETGTAVRELEDLLSRNLVPRERLPASLALVAGWRLKRLGDRAGARKVLERLVQEFPGTSEGYGASAQLWAIESEALDASQVVRAPAAPPRIVVRLPEASKPA